MDSIIIIASHFNFVNVIRERCSTIIPPFNVAPFIKNVTLGNIIWNSKKRIRVDGRKRFVWTRIFLKTGLKNPFANKNGYVWTGV